MKIKSYIWFVLVLGFFVLVLGLTGIPSAAQRVLSRSAQGLSASEREAAVDTSLKTTCGETTPNVPRALGHDAQVFSVERIGTTLSGVWRGRVSGNYDQPFLAKDGFVNVDYYMIIDVNRGEALVFEQFGDNRAAPEPKPGAPVWSYVTCGKDNYARSFPAQVHEFVKVSDNVEDARALLSTSTGLKFDFKELVLSDVWQALVDAKYFDDPKRSLAYAGALFKPFKIENVPSEGGSLLSMDMTAEYRGSGQTAVKFAPGEPIRGFERGKFLGVGTNSGDFLVASVTLGEAPTVAKEAVAPTGLIHYAYDKVVIGPLAPSGSDVLPKTSRK